MSEPDGAGTAPLLEPHNVRPFETIWPVERRGKPTAFRVCRDSLKHLVPARNYVLLRRFSAKEERRRLTASWFLHGSGIHRLPGPGESPELRLSCRARADRRRGLRADGPLQFGPPGRVLPDHEREHPGERHRDPDDEVPAPRPGGGHRRATAGAGRLSTGEG